MLNHFIEQHGSPQGENFFLGEYSFAEVVSTPFLQRGVVALKELRGYSLRTAIQQQKLLRLGKWVEVCLHACTSLLTTWQTLSACSTAEKRKLDLVFVLAFFKKVPL